MAATDPAPRSSFAVAYAHATQTLLALDASGNEDLELSTVLGLLRGAVALNVDDAWLRGTARAIADWRPGYDRRYDANVRGGA